MQIEASNALGVRHGRIYGIDEYVAETALSVAVGEDDHHTSRVADIRAGVAGLSEEHHRYRSAVVRSVVKHGGHQRSRSVGVERQVDRCSA